MEQMAPFFEMLMLICFGISWPISVMKSYRARTSKGKSLMFEVAIFVGYICGIISKLLYGTLNFALALYFINIAMVGTDIALYFRNRKLDKQSENK